MSTNGSSSIPLDKEFIYDELKHRYDSIERESENINTSASTIVGWNGLIISVLLTGGGLLISRGSDIILEPRDWWLLTSILICLGISTIVGLSFLIFGQRYLAVPVASHLIELSRTKNADELLDILIHTIAFIIQFNSEKNNFRTKILRISQIFFLVAVILAIMFLIEQGDRLIDNTMKKNTAKTQKNDSHVDLNLIDTRDTSLVDISKKKHLKELLVDA
jgi:hypothetical protein